MVFIEQNIYKHNFGIYCIRNIINDKRYIGQTSQHFQERFWHHKWKLNHISHDNKHLQQSWNKYGEDNFVFEILQCTDNKECLDDLEIIYIEKYKENVYNMLLGGGGRRGFKMSDHAKKIIGDKNRKHMLGRKHSEETKKKMSANRTGKYYNRYKSNSLCNDKTVIQIKTLLIQGISAPKVAETCNVDYKFINNILSSNTWSNIYVDGWDDFQKNRKIHKRMKKEEHVKIIEQSNRGTSKKDLAKQYNVTEGAIYNILKRA